MNLFEAILHERYAVREIGQHTRLIIRIDGRAIRGIVMSSYIGTEQSPAGMRRWLFAINLHPADYAELRKMSFQGHYVVTHSMSSGEAWIGDIPVLQ